MTSSWAAAVAALAAACACVASCGGGGSSPTTPTPAATTPPATTGGGGAAGASATIRITAAGVDPKEATIPVGGRVTFVNIASRNHDMSSDPHPTHENCPPINQVNVLSPGQQRDTGPFSTAGRCGFHDHNDPGNDALRGTIVIQ